MDSAIEWLTRADGSFINPLDPAGMTELLDRIAARVSGINAETLAQQITTTVQTQITEAITQIGVQVAPNFLPRHGAILTVWSILGWIGAKQDRLQQLLTKFNEIKNALPLSETTIYRTSRSQR